MMAHTGVDFLPMDDGEASPARLAVVDATDEDVDALFADFEEASVISLPQPNIEVSVVPPTTGSDLPSTTSPRHLPSTSPRSVGPVPPAHVPDDFQSGPAAARASTDAGAAAQPASPANAARAESKGWFAPQALPFSSAFQSMRQSVTSSAPKQTTPQAMPDSEQASEKEVAPSAVTPVDSTQRLAKIQGSFKTGWKDFSGKVGWAGSQAKSGFNQAGQGISEAAAKSREKLKPVAGAVKTGFHSAVTNINQGIGLTSGQQQVQGLALGKNIDELEPTFITFLLKACEFLGSCSHTGAFRAPSVADAQGDAEHVNTILAVADDGEELAVEELEHRPLVIALVIVAFMENLPEPLIPAKVLDLILSAVTEGVDFELGAVEDLLNDSPPDKVAVLRQVLRPVALLCRLEDCQNGHDLAQMFAPALTRQQGTSLAQIALLPSIVAATEVLAGRWSLEGTIQPELACAPAAGSLL